MSISENNVDKPYVLAGRCLVPDDVKLMSCGCCSADENARSWFVPQNLGVKDGVVEQVVVHNVCSKEIPTAEIRRMFFDAIGVGPKAFEAWFEEQMMLINTFSPYSTKVPMDIMQMPCGCCRQDSGVQWEIDNGSVFLNGDDRDFYHIQCGQFVGRREQDQPWI